MNKYINSLDPADKLFLQNIIKDLIRTHGFNLEKVKRMVDGFLAKNPNFISNRQPAYWTEKIIKWHNEN